MSFDVFNVVERVERRNFSKLNNAVRKINCQNDEGCIKAWPKEILKSRYNHREDTLVRTVLQHAWVSEWEWSTENKKQADLTISPFGMTSKPAPPEVLPNGVKSGSSESGAAPGTVCGFHLECGDKKRSFAQLQSGLHSMKSFVKRFMKWLQLHQKIHSTKGAGAGAKKSNPTVCHM
jgi:hypothetical protein